MTPCLKTVSQTLFPKLPNCKIIAITISCLQHKAICCILYSAYNSVRQEEAVQDIIARAQPGMQSAGGCRTGSSRENRESSSTDPLEKQHADAWTSTPEKYLEQNGLVASELEESSKVTKATPTCRKVTNWVRVTVTHKPVCFQSSANKDLARTKCNIGEGSIFCFVSCFKQEVLGRKMHRQRKDDFPHL